MSRARLADDPAECRECETRAQQRTCCRCGISSRILDCGHQAQPRPIAAGRADGSDLSRDYCADCATAQVSR